MVNSTHARAAVLCLLAAGLAAPSSVSAQAFRSSATFSVYEAPVRGSDVAFDYKNNVYLMVSAYGIVYGRFVSPTGELLANCGAPITIGGFAGGHFPRVAYSPDVDGGKGGFLVTWHENGGPAGTTNVHARTVSFNGCLGTDYVVSIGDGSFWENGPPAAYSPTTKKFLVVWQSYHLANINGRLLDLTGAPQEPLLPIAATAALEREPSIAHNPKTDRFYVVYGGWQGSSFVAGQMVTSAGVPYGVSHTLGGAVGINMPDVVYNPQTGTFLTAWWQGGAGSLGRVADGSTGAPVSDVIALSSRWGTYDSLDIDFNPESGTFFLVGQGTYEDGGVELLTSGVPVDNGFLVTATDNKSGTFHPRIAANKNQRQWLMSTGFGFRATFGQFIATNSLPGATPPPPPPPAPPPPPPPPAPAPTPAPAPVPVLPTLPVVQVLPFNYSGDVLRDVLIYNSLTGNWKIQVGNLQGGFDTAASGTWVPGLRLYRADWNGNGLDDLFAYSETTGAWSKINNSGTSLSYFSQVWLPGFSLFMVDLNADLRTDVFLYNPGTGQWYTAISVGDGTGGFAYGGGGWLPGFTIVPGDFDGDGRSDFLLYNPTSGAFYKAVTRGNGVFLYSGGGWSGGWTPVVAKLNGDILDDVFLYNATSGLWYRAISMGDGTGGFSYTGGGWSPGWTLRIADFDGDIVTDLLLYNPVNGLWFKAIGHASGFTYTGGGWAQWGISVSRLNGDIIDDVLLYDTQSGVWYQAITTPGGFTYTTGLFPQ